MPHAHLSAVFCDECVRPESQCAWPYRLQQWLTRSFPRLPLVVRNRADSDATIKDYAEKGHSSWWGEWKAGHVDLLLTDLTISHQGFREGVYPADSDVGVGEQNPIQHVDT